MAIFTLKHLRAVDALVIAFLFGLTFFFMIIGGAGSGWLSLLGVNFTITAAIMGLGRAASSTKTRIVHLVRDFYPVPMIFIAFKEVHVVIQAMARTDFDPAFIAIDRWLFGVDPTVWMAQFASPPLTEILQVSYASYYIIMLILGVELYRLEPRGTFSSVVFTLTYGFFLSYIGYILFPGVGPRFTLHDFAALNDELPGLFLTNPLREFINAGESIPAGAANPMALAQRDVFPSGHTQMTLITIFFSWKNRVPSRHVITLLGTLLIISTVYLRYHYVIDLAGGAAFMALSVLTAPLIERAWKKQSGAP